MSLTEIFDKRINLKNYLNLEKDTTIFGDVEDMLFMNRKYIVQEKRVSIEEQSEFEHPDVLYGPALDSEGNIMMREKSTNGIIENENFIMGRYRNKNIELLPNTTDDIKVKMIRLGEISGSLYDTLKILDEMIKKKIVKIKSEKPKTYRKKEVTEISIDIRQE